MASKKRGICFVLKNKWFRTQKGKVMKLLTKPLKASLIFMKDNLNATHKCAASISRE